MLRNLLFGGADLSSPFAHLGVLVLRLVPGLSLALAHGLGKLPPSERFVTGVAELGFPAPIAFAWAASLAESAGGFFMALGLFTRPAAFFVLFTMGTAFFLRHAADPFQKKELALLYGVIALGVLLIGAGRYSLDALFRGRKNSLG